MKGPGSRFSPFSLTAAGMAGMAPPSLYISAILRDLGGEGGLMHVIHT